MSNILMKRLQREIVNSPFCFCKIEEFEDTKWLFGRVTFRSHPTLIIHVMCMSRNEVYVGISVASLYLSSIGYIKGHHT